MILKQIQELIRLKREYSEEKKLASSGKDYESSFSEFIASKLPIQQIVSIHLGLDFGTSYTKVCFRQLETDDSGVLFLDRGDEFGFIESSVKIYEEEIITPFDDNWDKTSNQIHKIDNLKMILLDKNFSEEKVDAEMLNILIIYYLARIIQQSRVSFIEQQKERCFNKSIHWSASIGVPVKYFDSKELTVIQDLFNIAWQISEIVNLSNKIQNVSEIIRNVKNRTDRCNIPCFAVPEVVAAICSFINSQAAMDNIYLFMDIGGGTFDISSFSLINNQGEKRINILDTQIEPLGIKGFVNKYAYAVNGDWKENSDQIKKYVEKCLFNSNRSTHKLTDCNWEQGEEDIKQLVAKAVMNAKTVDDKNWFSKMQELQIFLGGGGSESPWYKESINRTYVNRQLKNSGIPCFRFQEMGIPDDFHLDEKFLKKFHRYAVSYGLSHPDYEYPQVIGFPRVNQIVEAKKFKKFDYDAKARELYGKPL